MNDSLATFTYEQKKVLFLSSLGGVLEFYDLIVCIFMAPAYYLILMALVSFLGVLSISSKVLMKKYVVETHLK